jgi:pimeloyl-ACP methyl ester carboxylesterase
MPYARRSGIELHYESFGRGAPLVLLHPIATNRYFWMHQTFALARTHRVLVPDLRGHGLSARPSAGYGIRDLACDLLAVFDDAGVEAAALVGNSAGGMIAVQTALDAPERVTALVVVSAGTNLGPSVPPVVFQAYAERFEAAFEFMLRGATSARTKAERPEVCAFLSDAYRVGENFAPEVFLSTLADPGGVFHWDVRERLAELRRPTLVLAGAEDQAIPPEATRVLAERIPGAERRVVPEVGHFYPLERPLEFNADLRAFLRGAGV